MIDLSKIEKSDPLNHFVRFYKRAQKANQMNIEAICISSFNKESQNVNSRFVNLKFIREDKLYFFTNYNSPKALDFLSHNQVSISIFWNSIYSQVRINGYIYKCSDEESDNHFKKRTIEKNALAISSNQSNAISSYEDIEYKYNKVLDSFKDLSLIKRPEYWGGFYVQPNKIEFWEGHPSRLNKRIEYKRDDITWRKCILEP